MRSFEPHIPSPSFDNKWGIELVKSLYRLFRDFDMRVVGLANGEISAVKGKGTAAPTLGRFSQGDFYANTNTTELGVAGSKYVIDGWRCVASGEPGTWVERRSLTGN